MEKDLMIIFSVTFKTALKFNNVSNNNYNDLKIINNFNNTFNFSNNLKKIHD